MVITLQDIIDNINDNCQNFDVTSIDRGNIIRQANRGIEYMQRRLGLPSDKTTFSFYYYEDTKFYDCPEGFNEFLQLYYASNNPQINDNNFPRNRWGNVKDTAINNWSAGYQTKNKVATTTVNGKNQLLISGHNQRGSVTINSFDYLTNLTFSADITNTSIDNTVYVEGSGSLKFDTSNALTASQITYPWNGSIQELFNENAAYRMYLYLPTGGAAQFSNYEIRFVSTAGNYYSITTTTQVTGAVIADLYQNLIGWNLSNASTVGTPDSTQITEIDIILNHSVGYTGVTNIRIDNLYQINPDYLTCAYYSAFKGTDTTGATPKIYLDDATDICYFGSYAPDLIEPIALRATVKLFPQLRGDITFWQMYKAEMDDAMRVWGRVYPHQRGTSSFGGTEILR